MSKKELQRQAALLLNLWEWASHFGEGHSVSFHEWQNYTTQGNAEDTVYGHARGSNRHTTASGRAWQRLLRELRTSPYPVEIVQVDPLVSSLSSAQARPVNALVFPQGTRATCGKILDRINVLLELHALQEVDRERALRRWPANLQALRAGGVVEYADTPSWVYAAVSVGVHHEVPCPECAEPVGLSCVRPSEAGVEHTTVHLSRVYAAMEARDHDNEDLEEAAA